MSKCVISQIEPPNLLVSTCETCDSVAIITLNRPTLRNTLSIETLQQLTSVFSELSQSSKTSVLVLHGLGEAFAAVADIKHLPKAQIAADVKAAAALAAGGGLFADAAAPASSPSPAPSAAPGLRRGGDGK